MRCHRSAALFLALACAPSEGEDAPEDGGSSSGEPTSADGSSSSAGPTSSADAGSDGGSESEGDSGPGDETGPPPELPDPILPEPNGECPDFMAGDQMIGDLFTSIVAGTPGDVPGPLILYWHGTGSSPGVELPLFVTALQREEILAEGGLIIAPVSNGEDRGGFSPNGVWYEEGDLDWADHVVGCALQNHNIDPRRIYTTGCSAGGLQAGATAVKRSNYIAAATPNSGGVIVTTVDDVQNPDTPPAIMTMHGGADDTVIINFGVTSATLNNLMTSVGSFAIDCNHMSGHCATPDILREAAWEFMKQHPFGTKPSPYEGGTFPNGFPEYCEVWD